MEGDGSQATSGSLNDSQHDPGKMFIGGLSWQTSPDSLRDYFSKFGEIRECMVMRDPTTKRSRGFGFVTFTDAASVDKVLAQQHHELDSKTIDPKVAFPRRAQPKMVTRTKKIFVGGLSANTVVEDVKQYFEQFGKVDDAMLMFDKTTNRHRVGGTRGPGGNPHGAERTGRGANHYATAPPIILHYYILAQNLQCKCCSK
uniref:RRM domain-containing protein n=1 Tax=Sphaeramia orbicularis TaxID=375764 RepID=A0A672YQW8_9TELE